MPSRKYISKRKSGKRSSQRKKLRYTLPSTSPITGSSCETTTPGVDTSYIGSYTWDNCTTLSGASSTCTHTTSRTDTSATSNQSGPLRRGVRRLMRIFSPSSGNVKDTSPNTSHGNEKNVVALSKCMTYKQLLRNGLIRYWRTS